MRMFQSEYKVRSRCGKVLNPQEHLIFCHFYVVLLNAMLSQSQNTHTLRLNREDYFIFLDSAE